MPRPRQIAPFVLVVTDHDQRTFSVEGPMTDDTRWNSAVVRAQESGRQVNCCNGGSDRAAAKAEYQRTYGYRAVPSGSIVGLGA